MCVYLFENPGGTTVRWKGTAIGVHGTSHGPSCVYHLNFVKDTLHRRCMTREAPLPKNPLFAFGWACLTSLAVVVLLIAELLAAFLLSFGVSLLIGFKADVSVLLSLPPPIPPPPPPPPRPSSPHFDLSTGGIIRHFLIRDIIS